MNTRSEVTPISRTVSLYHGGRIYSSGKLGVIFCTDGTSNNKPQVDIIKAICNKMKTRKPTVSSLCSHGGIIKERERPDKGFHTSLYCPRCPFRTNSSMLFPCLHRPRFTPRESGDMLFSACWAPGVEWELCIGRLRREGNDKITNILTDPLILLALNRRRKRGPPGSFF